MSRAGAERRPTRRLRTRLFVAFVLIAFGVLVASAAGTAALFRRTAADAAVHDLKKKAPEVERGLRQLIALQPQRGATAPPVQRALAQRIRRAVRDVLSVSGASLVVVTPDGQVTEGVGALLTGLTGDGQTERLLSLPRGLDPSRLDTGTLLAGQTQTGQQGRLVFIATPLAPRQVGTPVFVLTQEVEDKPLSRAAGFFLLAGGAALVVAGLVAFYLARRLTRPLGAMEQTANRIADGDLSARVDLGSHPDDELAGLARAIDGMAAELEGARGLERGFLLSVSHDLRTPLTSIKGYAEAISDGTVEGRDEEKRAAAVIASEARRLERLVADLLDLARLDAHQFSLTPRPVDAAEVVASAVDAFQPSAHEIGVRLGFEPEESVPVDVDPERLAQIVANLVENALKYASSSVTVGVVAQDGMVALSVDDDGPGISADDLPHVFERLYTSRTVPGRKVGTGLGLAIVHELAATMGGDASARSLDGHGTRFVVRLPVAR